jgi:DNA-directed RNA polymerase subunit H (RpoH/RPB5)
MKEFDITKHDLVPKHELLNEQQREEVLKKFGITLRQLPRIIETDPMVKTLGGKPGDVVKITRASDTAGESVYYRIVIKGEKTK